MDQYVGSTAAEGHREAALASNAAMESGAGDNVAASSGDSFLESLEAEAGLAMRSPPPTSTLEQLQAMAKGEQVVATDRAEIQRTVSRKFDSAEIPS